MREIKKEERKKEGGGSEEAREEGKKEGRKEEEERHNTNNNFTICFFAAMADPLFLLPINLRSWLQKYFVLMHIETWCFIFFPHCVLLE